MYVNGLTRGAAKTISADPIMLRGMEPIRSLPRGAWTCPEMVPRGRDVANGSPSICVRCGSSFEHPMKVCRGCEHLVIFHGRDTEGCGRISAGGWCACRRAFGRENAEYVRYA
jgi:hypothetical protein